MCTLCVCAYVNRLNNTCEFSPAIVSSSSPHTHHTASHTAHKHPFRGNRVAHRIIRLLLIRGGIISSGWHSLERRRSDAHQARDARGFHLECVRAHLPQLRTLAKTRTRLYNARVRSRVHYNCIGEGQWHWLNIVFVELETWCCFVFGFWWHTLNTLRKQVNTMCTRLFLDMNAKRKRRIPEIQGKHAFL